VTAERDPAVHQARFMIVACLTIIVAILSRYVWSWLTVALWVVVGAYAVMVLWAAGEAAWKGIR